MRDRDSHTNLNIWSRFLKRRPGRLPTTTRPSLAKLDLADLRIRAASETCHVSIHSIDEENRCTA